MMNPKELLQHTNEELKQLEEDLEKCNHLVSKEAIRESMRVREEFIFKMNAHKGLPKIRKSLDEN